MRDGNIIFDLVVHIHNLLDPNFETRPGRTAQPWKYDYIKMYKQGIEEIPLADVFYTIPPNPQAVVDKIFGPGSQIDYAMAQVVPLFELFAEDPDSNIQRVYEMCKLEPDRLIFCGGTDPVIRGMRTALDDITTQITTMGARSIKLYNAHSLGQSWRMDDRSLAYPMYERMLELGCNLVQVHKGDPQGMEPLNDLRPDDVHQAAIDFPDMNFVIHHLAFPFEDSAIDLGSRHPNVYLAMSTWINMIKIAPVETAMRFGKMLAWCSAEKVLWGSETPLWPKTQLLLDMAYDFQIPEEIQDGWGYPAITDADRKLMFGGNMLRLLGLEDKSDSAGIGKPAAVAE